MAYNSLEQQLGFISYIIMFVIINIAFFIHEFSKVCIANIISEHAVTKGVPIKKFIEPIGFILMFYFGVGWSNSCEINQMYFKNRKSDTLKVYLGAVFVNLGIGLLLIIIASIMQTEQELLNNLLTGSVSLFQIIDVVGTVIFAVGLMNLIPIVPFSGHKILYELVSPNTKMLLINNRMIVQMIVVFLIFFGFISGIINSVIYFVKMIF